MAGWDGICHQDVREARRAQDAISNHAARLFTALGGKSDLSRRWFRQTVWATDQAPQPPRRTHGRALNYRRLSWRFKQGERPANPNIPATSPALDGGHNQPSFHPLPGWRKTGIYAMDSSGSKPSIMTTQNTSQFAPGSWDLHDKMHDKFLPLVASQCKSSTGNCLQTPLIPRNLCIPAKSEHGPLALSSLRTRFEMMWAMGKGASPLRAGTEPQRRRRPIFNATRRAVALFRFFCVAHSGKIAADIAARSRLEKSKNSRQQRSSH